VVEEVRAGIEAIAFTGREGCHMHVTVSAGVVSVDPVRDQQHWRALSIESLYGQADDQLYRAKQQGRNQAAMA
jgi:PleD family two-component response regulator